MKTKKYGRKYKKQNQVKSGIGKEKTKKIFTVKV
jgi:uncharacterized protein YajQ (UPF0234 family)